MQRPDVDERGETEDESKTITNKIDDDEEVEPSQPNPEVENESELVFTQNELQNSPRLLSQESNIPESQESMDVSQEGSKEVLEINSSLEVEVNVSTIDTSYQHNSEIATAEEDPFLTEDQASFEQPINTEVQIKDSKKRKSCFDEPTSQKKTKLEDNSYSRHSVEVVFEKSQDKESSIVNISSSIEKIEVLDDSEDYSLRIEESTQPTLADDTVQISQETEGLTSHTDSEHLSSSNSQPVSQKSHNSCKSAGSNNCDKCCQYEKQIEELKREILQLKRENASPGSSSFKCTKPSDSRSSKESLVENGTNKKSRQENLFLLAKGEKVVYCTGHVLLEYDVEERSDKTDNIKVKEFTLFEDFHCVQEKPSSRLSLMSTTSHKSSSSTGSVGLPGPFPLPGMTRASILSTVSSSSSHSDRDGPFLKPALPSQDNPNTVPVSCVHCDKTFAQVDHSPSPHINGSPHSPNLEEEENKPQFKRIRKAVNSEAKQNHLTPSKHQNSESSGRGESCTTQSQQSSSSQSSGVVTPRPRGRPPKHPRPHTPHKQAQDSRPKTSTPISNTSACQFDDDTSSSKGEAVFAWWNDGKYYPGWVKQPQVSGESETAGEDVREKVVSFCDGLCKCLPTTKLVPASVIVPGTLVLALTKPGSAHYEEALVVNIHREDGEEAVFKLENDNVTRDVPFSSIALLESQVTELTLPQSQRTATPNNFNDVSLENIVSHPRKRSAKMSYVQLAKGKAAKKKDRKREMSPRPSTSHGQTFSGPEDYCLDTDSSTHSTCSLHLRGKEVKPLDIECSPPEVDESSRMKLSLYRKDMATKSKRKLEKADPFTDMYGPMPAEGSQLFAGCVFLITHTNCVQLLTALISSEHDINTSDCYDRHEDQVPMKKERIRNQIRNGGGKVYNSLNQVTKGETDSVFLISDKPCNTPLYLQCLVQNIPIYCSTLIAQCCKQNVAFKTLIGQKGVKRLPAGFSLTKRTTVQPRNNPGKPLRKKHLLLALSGDSSVTDYWANLIKHMGGQSEPYQNTMLEAGRYDIVVTDEACDAELVEQASKLQLPLVSLTWLQQCIITNDCRSHTEHPFYRHNTVVGQSSPEY